MSYVPPRIYVAVFRRATSFPHQVLCVPRSNLADLKRDGLLGLALAQHFRQDSGRLRAFSLAVSAPRVHRHSDGALGLLMAFVIA